MLMRKSMAEMMNENNLARTLELIDLCSLLNDEQIDFCLIGGLAVAILAKPRATEDIDLLILINEEKIPSRRRQTGPLN